MYPVDYVEDSRNIRRKSDKYRLIYSFFFRLNSTSEPGYDKKPKAKWHSISLASQ